MACDRCGGERWVLDPNEGAFYVPCHTCFPRGVRRDDDGAPRSGMAELRIRSLSSEEKAAARLAAEDAIHRVRERREWLTCPDCGAKLHRPSDLLLDENAPRLDPRPVLVQADDRDLYADGDGVPLYRLDRHERTVVWAEHRCDKERPKP